MDSPPPAQRLPSRTPSPVSLHILDNYDALCKEAERLRDEADELRDEARRLESEADELMAKASTISRADHSLIRETLEALSDHPDLSFHEQEAARLAIDSPSLLGEWQRERLITQARQVLHTTLSFKTHEPRHRHRY